MFLVYPAAAASDQPYNLTVNSKFLKATAKATSSHGVWAYRTALFLNYCPQCHSHGTLSYSKSCDGGQWTCSACDADYDMQTGYEKMPGSTIRLITYSMPKTQPTTQTSNTVKSEPKKEIKMLNLLKSKINENILLK